jgi:hypothetical protein
MTRSERRHRRARVIARRRHVIRLWYSKSLRLQAEENALWKKCAKNNFDHGCRLCHYEKYNRKEVRKRRRGLDAEVSFDLAAWQ